MNLDMFRRISSLGKRAGNVGASVGASVGGTLGIKHGLGYPIGVDFGVGSLKILQVNGGEPPSLVAAACLETPSDLMGDHGKRLEFQFEALGRLIRKGGFRGRRAVCSIPANQSTCRQLQFGRGDGVPIASLVAGAMASQLGCAPEALVFRHFELQSPITPPNRADVLCLAVSRDLVDRLMRAMVSAKLEPVGMHSEFVATVRSFDYVTRRAGDSEITTLYMDIGSGGTKLMIAHGRDLVFARNLEFGGRLMDQYIAKQLKVELDEARRQRLDLDTRMQVEQKRSESQKEESKAQALAGVGAASAATGTTDGVASEASAVASVDAGSGSAGLGEWKFTGEGVREERRSAGKVPVGFSEDVTSQPRGEFIPPKADLSEPLEALTDELQMCLRFHGNQFPARKVDRVIFLGGEARFRGLCQHIARALRLPAQTADPMARVARGGNEPCVGVDFKQPQPGWALALGLCLAPTDL